MKKTFLTLMAGTSLYMLGFANSPEKSEKNENCLEPTTVIQALPDDGIQTKIHKKNVGKIVFSEVLMGRYDDDESLVKTSFSKFSNGIHARLFMKQSVNNAYRANGRNNDGKADYFLEYYIDGVKVSQVVDKLTSSDADNLTNWLIVLSPLDAADANENKVIMNKFIYLISSLSGKHEIKLRAVVYGKNDVEILLGEGSFTIDIEESDRDTYVMKYGAKPRARGLLDSEPGLEDQVKKLIHPSVKDIRCPLAWEYRYNIDGEITHRVTKVETAYVDDEGKCRMGAFVIEQTNFGSHYSEAMVSQTEGLSTWGGVDEDLPCQNFYLTAE